MHAAAQRIPVRYAKAAAPLDGPKRGAKRDESREKRDDSREKRGSKREKCKREARKKRETNRAERHWKSKKNCQKLTLGDPK